MSIAAAEGDGGAGLAPEAVDILLVEDNPADVRLTCEALRGARFPCRVHVATDGVEAVDFLRCRGKFADAPRPQLILLDLNLPKKDGHAVLREIKADDSLRRIPVVVLTTSQAEADVMAAYDLHANAYVRKAVGLTSSRTSSDRSRTSGSPARRSPRVEAAPPAR